MEFSMPIDDRKFKFAPHCTLSSLAYVTPLEGGRWHTVNDGGDVNAIDGADFHRRCISIANGEDGEGVYSVVAATELGVIRKYVLNPADKTVSLEGYEHDIALDEFRKMAVRTTKDGSLIASFAEPLSQQWRKCKEAGSPDDHMMDIREMADVYRDSKDHFELYDHHMYNLESSEATDGLDFMQLMAKITAIGHPDGPTHERFPLKEAFEGWTEVRALPTYMQAPIRVAFDTFMREMIGDFSDDRVTMVASLHGEQFSEKLEAAGFELAGMLPPFYGKNMLPGYKSGDVAFHRARGVDIVVFSDFMGTYAYAWPTEEGGRFEMPTMTFKLG